MTQAQIEQKFGISLEKYADGIPAWGSQEHDEPGWYLVGRGGMQASPEYLGRTLAEVEDTLDIRYS